MILYRATGIFFALAFVLTTEAYAGPARLDGHWQGVMEREGAALTVRFDFQTQAGMVTGRFTSETQRAMEYPLDGVSYLEPKLHWKLGDSLVFDGVVSPESISGTFQDGQARGTFSLKPVKLEAPPYSREDIIFRNGGVILSGTLLRPKSAGLHPGVVFLHGSGDESRWGTSFFLADRFARHGVAALVFDKRGAGQSTGDWKKITYQVLAEDYMAGIHFLARQSGVNPKQVGIYGHSQGGTISPIIASRPGAVAFVIAAAAIGTGPLYTQDLYRTRNELLDNGLSEPELSRAMNLYSRWLNVARTGEGWGELDRAMAEARSEKWFDQLELPGRKDDWLYKWYPPVGNFNPLPLWEQVKVPVLLIYGERDRNTPVAPSLAGIGEALKKAGNSDFTPLIIPGAAHNLTIQWQPGEPFFWWHAAPGYSDLLTAWVKMRFPEK
ncbi:MAG TPA: alpha/beta fold hydrolase [Bryobacteraceae bacterium]|nr:alpha/beta fold hydrolase [Bryobacteraceae bacterium]